jgi:DUF2934 family protein
MESVSWDAVRQRAHALWLQDGCLEGRSEQHWQQAQHDVLASAQAAPVIADEPDEGVPVETPACAVEEVEAHPEADVEAYTVSVPADPTPSIPSPPMQGASLFKIKARQCRYVVSETCSPAIFCGALTDGGSWCHEHRARVFIRSSASPAKAVQKRAPP